MKAVAKEMGLEEFKLAQMPDLEKELLRIDEVHGSFTYCAPSYGSKGIQLFLCHALSAEASLVLYATLLLCLIKSSCRTKACRGDPVGCLLKVSEHHCRILLHLSVANPLGFLQL